MKKTVLSILLSLLVAATAFSQTIIVGGTSSPPINLQSGKNYSFLTVDGGNAKVNLVTGNNVHDVHIKKLYLKNTKGFGILLNGCTNILIDSTFFDNVGFGIYAQSGSSSIQCLANQFRDVNGIDASFLGHAIQFNAVNGGGNKMNYNRCENIRNVTDTSSHPHDIFNIYNSFGLVGDSIEMIGNWVRGGQLVAWPTSGTTGAGFIVGDVHGSYQVARNNICVNCGCAGIQYIGDGNSIKIDHNIFYSVKTAVSTNGINIQNHNPVNVSYNRTNWTNYHGNNVLVADGESQYDYFGGPTPTGQSTNHWQDFSVTPAVLPDVIITMAPSAGNPPQITYPNGNTFVQGSAITPLSPTNTGGAAVSYSVNTPMPSGLSLNTSTGVISGTPTVTAVNKNYIVTATNSGGTGSFTFSIQVVNPTVGKPVISYPGGTFVFTYRTTIPTLTPINTGGTATSWSINRSLSPGLSFNTSTGVITGTPTSGFGSVSYTVSASNAGGTGTAIVTIVVNKVNLTVTASNASRNYGAANPVFNQSYTGFVGGDGAGSLTTQPVVTTSATSSSNAGIYTLNASGGVSDNYSFTYVPGILTVNKVGLTVTAANKTRLYGAGNPPLTATYTGFVNGDNNGSLNAQPLLTTVANGLSPIGTYPILVILGPQTNYNVTLANGTMTVGRATLTITAQDKSRPVNTANPPLTATYVGFVNGQTNTILTAQPSLSTTAVTNSPAGTYPIAISGGTAANYTIVLHNGTLTVTSPTPSHGPTWHWHRRIHQHH